MSTTRSSGARIAPIGGPAASEAPVVAPAGLHGTDAAPRPPPSGRLRFDIRRVTLSGYDRVEQARFTRTLRAELARLSRSTDPGEWSGLAGARIDRLDAGEMRPAASPEEAAQQVARRIVEKVVRGGGTRNV